MAEKKINKEQLLDKALADIRKKYGEGAVQLLGDNPLLEVDVISTGCLPLDTALGVGGLPRGRIVEVYGLESVGKSCFTLQCIAQTQRQGGVCAFIDAEHSLDKSFAKKLGVDCSSLYVSQPDSMEEALQTMEAFIDSRSIDMVVLDSVASLVPKAELEGEMGDQQVALQARLMSQALRRLGGNIANSRCVALFINQMREKIDMMGRGSPYTTPGGRALKFWASVRVELKRIGGVKNSQGVDIGNRVQIKVTKNKVAPPFRECEVDLLFGRGISREGWLLDMGLEHDVIQRVGAYFYYQGKVLGQGRENTREALSGEVGNDIEKQLRQTIETKKETA